MDSRTIWALDSGFLIKKKSVSGLPHKGRMVFHSWIANRILLLQWQARIYRWSRIRWFGLWSTIVMKLHDKCCCCWSRWSRNFHSLPFQLFSYFGSTFTEEYRFFHWGIQFINNSLSRACANNFGILKHKFVSKSKLKDV
jgi:hypothetical protein